MQTRTFSLTLAMALMMFPQIAETIYSPALPELALHFSVTPDIASQTLSSYFVAFAFGVVFWGRACDVIGRRLSMLAGLGVYAMACLLAVFSSDFSLVLIARVMAAFGAAVGSVGTQTMIRDCYSRTQLARMFAVMGIAIALSPAIGVLAGALLVGFLGYQGVFIGLAITSVGLFLYAYQCLPETLRADNSLPPMAPVLRRLMMDGDVWFSAVLVAAFNINLFAYYQLAPFYFSTLRIPPSWYGYSGCILALGIGIGAIVNKKLLARGWVYKPLLLLSGLVSTLGSIAVWRLETSPWFVMPMIFVVMAYGIAIPNILAYALRHYADCVGTAGALFGMLYYGLIGIGLASVGAEQALGISLTVSSIVAMCIGWWQTKSV
ncbi:MFS transporter [Salinivibrio sp. MA351]|uniref:multidrug effflux MFS transporter n=1 Tax=unclassified Salinivibrio TaxID=2636825 RepID=UPI00098924B0|nr:MULTISPECIES: multidrug effflux MFS transporter [unclassified Salinivibrio]NUY55774.1 multidrug effflux MFS transporter [Salinivibrio sp. EAGSL]OOE96873.1 MFS transporter [Salinivibrio sp. MA351]